MNAHLAEGREPRALVVAEGRRALRVVEVEPRGVFENGRAEHVEGDARVEHAQRALEDRRHRVVARAGPREAREVLHHRGLLLLLAPRAVQALFGADEELHLRLQTRDLCAERLGLVAAHASQSAQSATV
ncbi:MAG: hypothetical protein U0325_17025 [Polyangiales bacterium]